MGFLVKVVDYHNRILYATPQEKHGLRHVDSRNKAEVFNDKLDAIKTALSMKHTEGLEHYIYHIMEI